VRALRLTKPGHIEIDTVPVPRIGPEEVLVKVAGAGLCQSDLHVTDAPRLIFGKAMTLGHETAGHVAATGPQVTGFAEGDPVLVCLVWACGTCRACAEGRDNVCMTRAARRGTPPAPGLGPDGGMAEYIKADHRYLEPLGPLDPKSAGPLADAGLTPMHAVNGARYRLTPGATALVIGIGGLGHMGLQILRATSSARIIAVDTSAEKLAWALNHGADHAVLAGEDASAQVLELVAGYGVDALFDFVGSQPTLDLASAVIAPDGALRVIGSGEGTLTFGTGSANVLPRGVDLRHSYAGGRVDQRQVIELAAQGKITLQADFYDLEDGPRAFSDLRSGNVAGRAILVP
jgi:propanol-preferring alcohol dehydrogenase